MVHRVEATLPLIQRGNAIQDEIEIDLPAGKHRQHAFPDRPVMAVAALQRNGFLNQRIERKVAGLRSPADFGDLPPGRTISMAVFRVALTPAASITTSTP